MPNWVKTRVVGTDLQKIKEAIVNEAGEVDFNKLIPMPADLEHVIAGSHGFKPDMPVFPMDKKGNPTYPIIPSLLTYYNSEMTQSEFLEKSRADEKLVKAIVEYSNMFEQSPFYQEEIDSFIKGFFNYRRYGYTDWYEWSIAKWGTKWNATESFIDDDYIEFSTAWSVPEPVLHELAKICPIRVAYADEDLGTNCGLVDISLDEEGNPTNDFIYHNSEELARVVWGYTDDEYFHKDESEEERKDFIKRLEDFEKTFDKMMMLDTVIKDFTEV